MCDVMFKGSFLKLHIRNVEEYKEFIKTLIENHKSPNYSLDVVISKGDEIGYVLIHFTESRHYGGPMVSCNWFDVKSSFPNHEVRNVGRYVMVSITTKTCR
jgi:hypothetical protein